MRIKNNKELSIILVSITLCLAIIVACLLMLKSELLNLRKSLEAEKEVEFLPTVVLIESEPVPELECTLTESDYEVMRILTAEAGTDQTLCGCVAQCLFNACEKLQWEYTPLEVAHLYQYAQPVDWISEEASTAYDQVFYSGFTYTDVQDALYFYAPKYCDSSWHEHQRFVTEINGVRFFGDVEEVQ